MKRILILAFGVALFTSCSKSSDSNPTPTPTQAQGKGTLNISANVDTRAAITYHGKTDTIAVKGSYSFTYVVGDVITVDVITTPKVKSVNIDVLKDGVLKSNYGMTNSIVVKQISLQ